MAYINRLSDINNKLDINIENQVIGNDKLNNIDDNIETIRNLNNNTNTKLETLHTDITSTNTKLDTLHTDLDGLTFDGSSNLNVNIVSGSISVSSVNIKDSAGNNLNSTSNALNSYITNASIPVTGTFYQATQPVSGTVSSKLQDGGGTNLTSTAVTTAIRGIDTASALYTTDGTTRTALTSTTNNYSISGLNMYQIIPKRKTYTMKSTTFYNAYNNILGGYYSNAELSGFDTSTKIWYYRFTNGTTISSALYGDYIDTNGVLQEDQLLANMTSSTGSTTFTALLGGVAIRNINSWRMSPNPTLNSTMDICNANNQAASLGGYYYNAGANSAINLSLCGVFCVPNGYIAWVPQLCALNTGGFHLGVIYANGSRRLIGNYYVFNASREVVSGGTEYSGIGGTFSAGDRLFLVSGDAGTTQRSGAFDVVIQQI